MRKNWNLSSTLHMYFRGLEFTKSCPDDFANSLYSCIMVKGDEKIGGKWGSCGVQKFLVILFCKRGWQNLNCFFLVPPGFHFSVLHQFLGYDFLSTFMFCNFFLIKDSVDSFPFFFFPPLDTPHSLIATLPILQPVWKTHHRWCEKTRWQFWRGSYRSVFELDIY